MAKILIVEDDKILAEMYQEKFNHEGHQADVALSGEQALTELDKFKPELILLDILMPKLNGFHILKEIKKVPEYSNVPIVLLTNLDQAEVDMSEDMARAIGVADYLVKGQHTPDEVVARAIRHLKK
jgi:DNA-binding response OmpR family regulator